VCCADWCNLVVRVLSHSAVTFEEGERNGNVDGDGYGDGDGDGYHIDGVLHGVRRHQTSVAA
jgi:hypothetical protein